ncbi:MAG: RagB/SusD family nutrient uptake outer membrane protein [Dysgonamonadaceae bacterium]|jgi:hypothetical protein|nr:RagB/SusD family nutrient uptake outer membrane protein [Dysgonamonadaceae bacterium]
MFQKLTKILFVCIFGYCLVSCSDWLDISPKTEIKAKDNFQDEQGFKDALTGVYLLMTQQSLYGRELTFGFNDVMAQYYTGVYATSHSYYHAKSYNFTEASCVSRINAIWLNMYNVIANLNELIINIEDSDKALFTGRNYDLIKGEAYGLRAFLHFDLLRLFGKSYIVDSQSKAIPWINTVSAMATPLSTVEEILNLALSDLQTAENSLLIDPVIATNESNDSFDSTYERDRCFKFNYYAVKLLQARIYLYKKDFQRATEAAEAVINQEVFYWTPLGEINNSDSRQRNSVFSEELVFTLYISNLNEIYTSWFTGNYGLYMLNENYDALYELYSSGLDHDTRYEFQSANYDDVRFSTKLKQTAGITAYLYRMPIMRLSEAYYIAAESAINSGNTALAAKYLNTVRMARQIEIPLSETLSREDAENELYKEYAKEFFAEGQLFYFFKRLNYSLIPIRSANGQSITVSYVVPSYVLPLPDDEIEYGGRNNE